MLSGPLGIMSQIDYSDTVVMAEMSNLLHKKRRRKQSKSKRGGRRGPRAVLAGLTTNPDACHCVRGDDVASWPDSHAHPKQGQDVKKNLKLLRPRYSPRAPQNSTQFLMDDHLAWELDLEQYSPDYERSMYSPDLAASGFSGSESDVDSSELNDVDDTYAYMAKDFEIAFRDAQEERMSNMSHSELVSKILSLEERLEMLSEHSNEVDNILNNDTYSEVNTTSLSPPHNSSSAVQVPLVTSGLQDLEMEIQRLRAENNRLKNEITSLL